jgi:hypothetical protein
MPTRSAIGLSLIAAFVLALLVVPRDAMALSCANPWGEPFAGARELVAGNAPWGFDGLLIGTVTTIERPSDGTPLRTLVVKPEVVFAGPVRGVVRLQIGPHGPNMSFSEGSRYFLVLHAGVDPAGRDWIVDPCGPSMEITSSSQLQELRDLSAGEIVLAEPQIPPASNLPAVLVASIAAMAGWWFATRRGRSG